MSHGPRWRADIRDLLGLAWPVIINRLGVMTLGVVDTIMVGQYAAEHLAYFGIGLVPSNILVLVLVGLLMGVPVLVAQRFGAGASEDCGFIWWQSLPYALMLGLFGLVLCSFAEPVLVLFGQSPELAQAGGVISRIAGFSLPLLSIYMATSMFLEGIRRVRPGMVIVIIANIINLIANYVLIYGAFGMPEMGAQGAVWASFCVRLGQVLLIFGYVWMSPDIIRYGVRQRPKFDWVSGREMRKIGYLTSVSVGIEHAAFNALVLFAGVLGTMVLAAHVITINVFALGFMVGLGFSVACGVRVGNAHGAGHHLSAQRNGWMGLGVQMAVLFSIGLVLSFFADRILMLYTADPAVRELGASMLRYLSLFLFIDAGQSLMAQAMRARGDATTPMYIHLLAYGGVMIPLTYVLSFTMERGALGLIDSTVISSILALGLGVYGFHRLGRRLKTEKQ